MQKMRAIKLEQQNRGMCKHEKEVAARPHAKVDGKTLATGCILNGLTYTQASTMFHMCNVDTVSSSTFYEAQKEVEPIIIDIANKTVEKAKEEAKALPELVVGEDSRWDSARNGSHNTVIAIENTIGKVISYKNTIKCGGKRCGNYVGPSNMMESEGQKYVNEDIRKTFGNVLVKVTTDGDNKCHNILQNSGLNFEHSYDKGHGVAALKRRLENAKKTMREKFNVTKPLYGIEGRIIRYGQYLINHEEDPEKRVKLWLNAPKHYIGDHSKCEHPSKIKKVGRPSTKNKKTKRKEKFYVWKKGVENENLFKGLQKYCDETSRIIANTVSSKGTNQNESINAQIAKYAPKRIAFGNSYEARSLVSIGMKNDPEHFTRNVLEATHINISQECWDKLEALYNERHAKNTKRRNPYERLRMDESRINLRLCLASKESGDYVKVENLII